MTENGQRKKVPGNEVVARRFINKAMAGDLGAMRLLVQLCREANEQVAPTIQLIVSDDDMQL